VLVLVVVLDCFPAVQTEDEHDHEHDQEIPRLKFGSFVGDRSAIRSGPMRLDLSPIGLPSTIRKFRVLNLGHALGQVSYPFRTHAI
jgi:hypothetical protein